MKIEMKSTVNMKRFFSALFMLVIFQSLGLHAQAVWPGDVNNNGIVNGVDMLFWGHAFGAEGPSRDESSTEWQAFPLPTPWSQNFSNGLNYAYADCNGDGIIDEDDFDDAIEDNYGEVHGIITSDGFLNADANSAAPKLTLETSTPVVLPGSTVNIDLSIAPTSGAAENFYGIALSLKYESSLLEGDDGPDFDLVEDNWIGADGSYVQEYYADNDADSTAMLAITRTNQQFIPIQESSIGSFSIVIEDIIFGLERDTFTLEIDSVRFISEDFRTIPVITDKVDIVVTTDTTTTKDSTIVSVVSQDPFFNHADKVKIFPNPVKHRFFLQTSTAIENLELFDQLGRKVASEYSLLGKKTYEIKANGLTPGVYWVRWMQNHQIQTKKVIFLN